MSHSSDKETQIHALLQQFDSLELAEDYGVLCGLLCMLEETSAATLWREHSSLLEIADDNGLALLEKMILRVHSELFSDDYEFDLLLPEDSDDLQMRLYALSNYCRGFISGAGLGGLQRLDQLDPDISSFFQDLGVIAEGSIETSHSEEDEISYTEISEYVRAGTMLVARDQVSTKQRVVH
jgi:uncharacterized protein YgfB (UPF0149 family)